MYSRYSSYETENNCECFTPTIIFRIVGVTINFKKAQTLDKEKHLNIVSYFDFLNKVKIKVGFYPKTTKEENSLHREFNGTEILRFLDTIELKDVYPKNVRTNMTPEDLKEEDSIKKLKNISTCFSLSFRDNRNNNK